MCRVLLVCSLFVVLCDYIDIATGHVDAFALLKALASGTDLQIGRKDKELIESWMDAGRVDGQDSLWKCSVDYVRQLKGKIETDMQNTTLDNVEELYYFAELDLLSSCGDMITDLAQGMILPPEEKKALKIVVSEFDRWFCYEPGHVEWSDWQCLSESISWAIGIDNCVNKTNFMSAWNSGPCSAVLDQLNESHMQPLVDYVKMIADTRVKPSLLVSSVDKLTISIVLCCEYFRSEHTLTQAWDALQTSDFYQYVARRYGSRDNPPQSRDESSTQSELRRRGLSNQN